MRTFSRTFSQLTSLFKPRKLHQLTPKPRHKASFSNRQELESRVMLIAFVDVNNNAAFDAAMDIDVTNEVMDGSFNTDVAEGNYATVIQGAGLVIDNLTIDVNTRVNLSADANITIRGTGEIISQGDIAITSRNQSVVIFTGMDAGGKLTINASLTIIALGTDSANQIVLGSQGDITFNITANNPAALVLLQHVLINSNGGGPHDLEFNLKQNPLQLEDVSIGGSGGGYNFTIESAQAVVIIDSTIDLSTLPKTSFNISSITFIQITNSTIVASGNIKLDAKSNFVDVTSSNLTSRNGFVDLLGALGVNVTNSILKGFKRVRLKTKTNPSDIGFSMVQIGILNGSTKGKVDIDAKQNFNSFLSSITAPNPNKNVKLSNPLIGSIGIFDGTVAP